MTTRLYCEFCGEPQEEAQKQLSALLDRDDEKMKMFQDVFNCLSVEGDIPKAKRMMLDFLEDNK